MVWMTDRDAGDETLRVWGIETGRGALVSFEAMKQRYRELLGVYTFGLVVGVVVLASLWAYFGRVRWFGVEA